MIDLYTDATPNGLKVSIALEEMGLEYTPHSIFLGGDQFSSEFSALNPNNKIPVLKDNDFILSESGAILLYLAEKTGKFMPTDFKGRAKAIEMLMFQMGSLGPMFGQYLVFAAAWGNKFPDVTKRYFMEVSRILRVLEVRLSDDNYLAGSEYSIVDMAYIPWIRMCKVHPAGAAFPLQDNPNLVAWLDRVLERPAVQKGLMIPEPFPMEKQFEGFIKATVGLGDLHA